MLVSTGLEALRTLPRGCVVSVGNFDGLHVGHRQILHVARQRADTRGGALAAVTFEPHPLTVLRPNLAPPRLTPSAQKHQKLRELGVDSLIELPPSPDVLNTSAETFYGLLRDAGVAELVEGNDFNFGKGRGGTMDRLREWTARDGVTLTTVPDVEVTLSDLSIVAIRSSIIRWLLLYGRTRDAAIGLGSPYMLQGYVVHGEKRGRVIGFPTVNLACGDQLLPASGVYAARTTIDGSRYAVALSIGTKPHFDGVGVTVEGHLLNFSGDLYGRVLDVEVLDWLREQQKYPSLDALIEQLRRDVERVRSVISH